MISISKLYCGTITPGDVLRYGRDSSRSPSDLLRFTADKKPVVVWNITRRCNLRCIHCYSDSENKPYPGELSDEEGTKVIENLAEFGVPVLLFSGGEPLIHPSIFDFVRLASSKGIRAVISTNGTLLTKEVVGKLKDAGVSYAGISIDGLEETNDSFRGKKGAFRSSLDGIRNCTQAGVKAGLRLTLTKRNFKDLQGVFALVESEGIPRVCFYHLVYSGRGGELRDEDISHEGTRRAVDMIMDWAVSCHKRGLEKDILTVDNHTDGVYLYLRMLRERRAGAEQVRELLLWNGGNSSGIGIACIDNQGNVHPDQFWQDHSFGNVRERKFGDIWADTSDPLLAKLKDRRRFLKGKCGRCHWVDMCNGNFRARAVTVYNDPWMEDPACYLTEEEIAGSPPSTTK
jgi:radical SAM protein with 4Fe4S-binding SPASM domain